jgi:hypothetical protein
VVKLRRLLGSGVGAGLVGVHLGAGHDRAAAAADLVDVTGRVSDWTLAFPGAVAPFLTIAAAATFATYCTRRWLLHRRARLPRSATMVLPAAFPQGHPSCESVPVTQLTSLG